MPAFEMHTFFASMKRAFYDNPRRINPAYDGPITIRPNFLFCDECDDIIELGTELDSTGMVLNHRVNRDIATGNSSAEALALILEQNLNEVLTADYQALPPSVLN